MEQQSEERALREAKVQIMHWMLSYKNYGEEYRYKNLEGSPQIRWNFSSNELLPPVDYCHLHEPQDDGCAY